MLLASFHSSENSPCCAVAQIVGRYTQLRQADTRLGRQVSKQPHCACNSPSAGLKELLTAACERGGCARMPALAARLLLLAAACAVVVAGQGSAAAKASIHTVVPVECTHGYFEWQVLGLAYRCYCHRYSTLLSGIPERISFCTFDELALKIS